MLRLRVLAVLSAFLLLRCARETPAPAGTAASQPPVILISIDTLRSDHLPAYGYKGVETPHLDALRRDAILFRHAWSHAPLTLPSHVSMLTGLLPTEHGVRNNLGYRYDPAAHRPVTRALKEAGYDTGAAISAYVLRGETGLREAFDFYEDSISASGGAQLADLQRGGEATESLAESWIAQRDGRPFFFMLHLFEPHAPYTPPAKFARFAHPYDGEIAAADEVVGRFLDFLKRSGIYDRALIVLTSDHGEGLNEHGEEEHGIFLYREAIQVPLLMKLPGAARAGTSVDAPVQLIDLAPTIASAAGLPWTGRGRSLLTESTQPRRIYSETFYPRIHFGWSELRSLVDATHHYIEAPRPELYDLRADAAEKTNILADQRRVYASMKSELAGYASALQQPANISAEDAAKLAALGYVGSAGGTGDGPLPDPKDEIRKVRPMQEAARLAATGKRAEAVIVYRAVLRENPRLVPAWTALATELETLGRVEEAVEAWGEAMRNVPQIAPNIALSRGNLLLRLGRLDDAARDAQTAAPLNAAAAHQLLARIALMRRDFAAAEREARLAMEDPGHRVTASLTVAQALAAQGRREEALALLDRTLVESRTPVPFLQFARGDLLVMLDRRAEAAQAFREEIRLFPSHLRAYANLAAVQLMEGRPADATAILEEMVRVNPRPEAYLIAARLYQTLGDAKTAAEWERRARVRTGNDGGPPAGGHGPQRLLP